MSEAQATQETGSIDSQTIGLKSAIAQRHDADIVPETNQLFDRAISNIRRLGSYASGWNGPGTVAPTPSTVQDAEVFLRYLFGHSLGISPHISASGDGEINFYWKREGFILDLGFQGDGFYSYYADLPNGREMMEDAAALSQPLPEEIVNFICSID
jgi:hypothetical protein